MRDRVRSRTQGSEGRWHCRAIGKVRQDCSVGVLRLHVLGTSLSASRVVGYMWSCHVCTIYVPMNQSDTFHPNGPLFCSPKDAIALPSEPTSPHLLVKPAADLHGDRFLSPRIGIRFTAHIPIDTSNLFFQITPLSSASFHYFPRSSPMPNTALGFSKLVREALISEINPLILLVSQEYGVHGSLRPGMFYYCCNW